MGTMKRVTGADVAAGRMTGPATGAGPGDVGGAAECPSMMRAVTCRRYGGPEVLRIARVARPVPGPGEVLVRVASAVVTTADWRLRAAAFPGVLAPLGRAMFGVFRPRNPVPGSAYAGRVVAAGPGAELVPGTEVLGFAPSGAHAEYLVAGAGACIRPRPEEMGAREGAALSFGGLSALVFLRDVARLAPGQRVLIAGGSGEVGAMAVQIAVAMGAQVTATASAGNLALLRELGAQEVLDYRRADPGAGGPRFDLVLDTFGALRPAGLGRILRPGGIFVPLNFGLPEIAAALVPALASGRRVKLHVSGDRPEDLQALLDLWQAGHLRPVIGQVFPMEQVAAAHALVESRHKRGAVVLDMQASGA